MSGARWTRWLVAAMVSGLVCTVSLDAWAQRVVLVRPPSANAELSEAFNRLRGELSLHGFEVIVVDAPEAPSPDSLASTADEGAAVASVSFVEAEGHASVDVWISDRVTGKTSLRTISTRGSGDAPSLLALRATELLRASLREYGPESEPPPDVSGANPERADPVVKEWAEEDPRPASRFWLGAGVTLVASFPDPAAAAGPELALGWRARRGGLRAVLLGPALGARFGSGERAEARFRSLAALAEARLALVAARRGSLSVLANAGATYLAVEGEAQLPYVGRDDAAWVGAFGGGVEGTVRLGQDVAAFATSRALVLAPQPVIEVGEDEARAGRPAWASSLGLRVAF